MKFSRASRQQIITLVTKFYTYFAIECILAILLLALFVYLENTLLVLVLATIQSLGIPVYILFILHQAFPHIEKHTGLDQHLSLWKMYRLNPFDFEEHIAFLFRRAGFDTVRVTGGKGADGGIDLIITHHNKTIAVQCKRYHPKHNPVGVNPVRELIGSAQIYRCDYSIFITTSWFSDFARLKTDDSLVAKIDGKLLEQWSRSLYESKPMKDGGTRMLHPSTYE